ncbi:PTS sugar transporter subunit IIA [Pectinatus sottacetonis]|uniref:PTS sugar transporter subunit IIA n=1 Tax=Pectinatus sottacetonis TaxID=1002795 RepID=UPI0018C50C71|nr:fructose PTS transporter subunit IIA [Pectinatus sottacetonis]
MKISSENIFLEVFAENKEEVFTFLAKQAMQLGLTKQPDMLKEVLKKREKEISTGLQDGFAIPHAKSSIVEHPSLLYVRLSKPLKWDTFDGSDVVNILCLLIPEKHSGNAHLQILSKLAVCLMEKEFRDDLKNALDCKKVVNVLQLKMEGK